MMNEAISIDRLNEEHILLMDIAERMGARNGDYFEEYLQKNVPTKIGKEDFLIKVSCQTELEHKVRPQTVLRAVLEVLHDQLSAGEISNIHNLISHDVHELIA